MSTDRAFVESLIGRELGGCRIEESISGGGMAHVFRAHHLGLDKTVAVKVLSPAFSPSRELRDRFHREARIAGAIEHPGVVPVYGVGDEGDSVFIVMRHLDGASLYRVLSRQGMDQLMAAKIGEQVAAALGAVHRAGFVHRDVKPENIMLSHRGEAFLTDFGVACEIGTAEKPGRGGSPPYMSPEQCRGEPLDGRSDLYSLGVTLYQMLSGRRPFMGATPASLMLMHEQDVPPPLRTLRSDIDDGLAAIVEGLLAKHPAQRPQTASQLAQTLRDVQDDLRTLRRKSSMLIQPRGDGVSGGESAISRLIRQTGDEADAEAKVEEVELSLLSLPEEGAGSVGALTNEELGTREAKRAGLALSKSRYEKALEHVNRALGFRPNDPRLLVTRGHTHRRRGDEAAAESDYRAALAVDADNLRGLTALGSLLRQQGKLGEAETHLRRAVDLEPANAEARIALGKMYETAAAPGLAKRQYEAAIEATPHDERPYVAAAALLIAQKKHAAAKSFLDSARERNPAFAPALFWLAVIAAHEGSEPAALELLESAIKAGLRDVKRLNEQPEFQALRSHYRFQALLTLLKG